jgi:hypothetical protein
MPSPDFAEVAARTLSRNVLRFYTARVSEYLRDAIYLLDKLRIAKTELSGGSKVDVIEECPKQGSTLKTRPCTVGKAMKVEPQHYTFITILITVHQTWSTAPLGDISNLLKTEP